MGTENVACGPSPVASAHLSLTSLSRLLQVSSAASPVGSFGWSEGLEAAMRQGYIVDESTARAWLFGLLEHGIGSLDLPVFLSMLRAITDGNAEDAIQHSAWLLACRETSELRRGDREQGQALLRILVELGVPDADRWRHDEQVSYAFAFALACDFFDVPAPAAVAAFAYTWVENQVQICVKLLPLGQSAGQRLIGELADRASLIASGLKEADCATIAS